MKGFKKSFLQPGETKTVQVEMEMKYVTSYWDEVRNAWIRENGVYKVQVGNSSQCDFLTETFEVEKTSWWTGL